MFFKTKWNFSCVFFLICCAAALMFPAATMAVLPDIYEEDDTHLLADVIGLNYDTQRHNFHDAGDQDWVKFYGVAGEIYEIRVSNVEANCDPVIELYDLDGETLLQGPWDWWGNGEQELMDWDCSRDGIYYVMIRHSDPSVFGDATGYDLDVYRPVAVFTGFVIGSVVRAGPGAPIEGAQVVSDGGGSTISLPDGSFILVEKAGTYTVTASAAGFRPASTPGVTVAEFGSVTVNFELTSAAPFGAIDIKANGSDGPVTVANATPVSIDISIDPGGYAGQNADWWVYLDGYFSSTDYYSYVVPRGWVPGFRQTAAYPLFPFAGRNILNMRLPPGSYVFCFATDSNADGIMDWTWGDVVQVNVQ